MTPSLVEQIKIAKSRSVPLAAINTPDPAATVQRIVAAMGVGIPTIEWDIVRGVRHCSLAGEEAVDAYFQPIDDTQFAAIPVLLKAAKAPPHTLLFVHLAHRWLTEPA